MDPEAVTTVREVVAPEDDATAAARARCDGVLAVPSAEIGALLAWATASRSARHVVEVGAAGGVSGLWLLRGMADRGMLTSVEPDPHHHGLATRAFEEAGVSGRVRAILGDPVEVLPRLSDGGYDVCLVQTPVTDLHRMVEHALRLLVPGGVVIARIAAGRDGDALAYAREVVEHPRLTGTVLPLDGWLVLATVVAGAGAETGQK